MNLRSLFTLNALAMLLLAGGFGASLVMVLRSSHKVEDASGDGAARKIVRVAHWQLEPGYRESFERVIQAYNNLPRVKAAGVRVQQQGVTEKVYQQWLNVQLISGTAPDICEKGLARMAGTDYVAKFFEPLGDYAAQPNPYNAAAYLPADAPADLARMLATSPWRETFIDGMRGGWDERLADYYAVPTSFFGAVRLYYNKTLIGRAMRLTSEALNARPQPAWLGAVLEEGYVVDGPALREWASSAEPPRTLGRLLLVCAALREMGRQSGDDKLVPIAGSSYSHKLFETVYLAPFTAGYSPQLDRELDSDLSDVDTLAGWRREWDFNDGAIKAYYECLAAICRQFPPGFLALERDQANNRFVLGSAGMIASGAWDAESIFRGVASRSRPEDRFEVGIMQFPLPGPGEKWSAFATMHANEAQNYAGAPFAIDQRSRNKAWALDFLQYLSSYSVNQQFNRDAGWIPVILGSTPTEAMKPFAPDATGICRGTAMSFKLTGSNLRTVYEGQLWLFMSGDIDYATFSGRIEAALLDDRGGVRRLWFDEWEKRRNNHRNSERMLAVQTARQLLLDEPDAAGKYRRGLYEAISANNGNNLRAQWRQMHGDEPFPQY